MKNFKLKFLFSVLTATVMFSSCRKNSNTTGDTPVPYTPTRQGFYVLNEGGFNKNNATVSYYGYGTQFLTTDQFSAVNGRGLGDTGNDIEVYGSRVYVVVNVSSTIEVIDARTAKSIKQIPMQNAGAGRQPRNIIFNGAKAYISSYDGTVGVLDTASLTFDKFIPVGRNPEQLAISNGKIYVANSGGLSYPNYDNTVSVIDLVTLTETKKITVASNPNRVVTDQYGDVIVLSSGNYSTVNASMAIIDNKTDAVKSQTDFKGGPTVVYGDNAYILSSNAVKVFNVKSQTVTSTNFITDGTAFKSAYGLSIDQQTGEVFVTDAKDYASNGTVTAFTPAGVKEYTLNVGINPDRVAFIYR